MYAAQIVDGIVTQVIVGSKDWATANLGGDWFDSEMLVGIGWTFDPEYGCRPPSPYSSWVWRNDRWEAPTPQPAYNYVWDEEIKNWVAIVVEDGDFQT